nr:helix-turn-helix transcriptional regulator [Kibdelosporangium sp. MJ126-NF4]
MKRGTARIRGLAAELKDLRAESGLNTRDAAKRVGMSAATLNRMELGNRVIGPEETSALLAIYGVTGKERERVLAMSRETALPDWWVASRATTPKHLRNLIRFEAEATRIIDVSMLRIPGLMQTADYTRALMAAAQVPSQIAERRISNRLERQRVLTRLQPPYCLTIIDEAALSRPVGGPRVMAEQLRHIMDLSRLRNVEVRVIPFERGAHTGLDGSYITLEFAKARPLIFLEHKRATGYIDDPGDVVPYRQATDTLMEAALDSPESVDFLARKAAAYDKG